MFADLSVKASRHNYNQGERQAPYGRGFFCLSCPF